MEFSHVLTSIGGGAITALAYGLWNFWQMKRERNAELVVEKADKMLSKMALPTPSRCGDVCTVEGELHRLEDKMGQGFSDLKDSFAKVQKGLDETRERLHVVENAQARATDRHDEVVDKISEAMTLITLLSKEVYKAVGMIEVMRDGGK